MLSDWPPERLEWSEGIEGIPVYAEDLEAGTKTECQDVTTLKKLNYLIRMELTACLHTAIQSIETDIDRFALTGVLPIFMY